MLRSSIPPFQLCDCNSYPATIRAWLYLQCRSHTFGHHSAFSLFGPHWLASNISRCRSRLGCACTSLLLPSLSTCPFHFYFHIFSYLPLCLPSLLDHITHIIHSILHLVTHLSQATPNPPHRQQYHSSKAIEARSVDHMKCFRTL
jgi:hypothetical protein